MSCIETDDCKSWTVHTFSIVRRYVLSKNSNVYGFYQEVGVEG